MHNYESAYGKLPPAAIVDRKGKKLLSWRVMILPYIEQDNLYRQFKLDEPWDSEHNKKLIPLMPKVYADPRGPAEPGKTYYKVFVGKDAGFDWVKGRSLADYPRRHVEHPDGGGGRRPGGVDQAGGHRVRPGEGAAGPDQAVRRPDWSALFDGSVRA